MVRIPIIFSRIELIQQLLPVATGVRSPVFDHWKKTAQKSESGIQCSLRESADHCAEVAVVLITAQKFSTSTIVPLLLIKAQKLPNTFCCQNRQLGPASGAFSSECTTQEVFLRLTSGIVATVQTFNRRWKSELLTFHTLGLMTWQWTKHVHVPLGARSSALYKTYGFRVP